MGQERRGASEGRTELCLLKVRPNWQTEVVEIVFPLITILNLSQLETVFGS